MKGILKASCVTKILYWIYIPSRNVMNLNFLCFIVIMNKTLIKTFKLNIQTNVLVTGTKYFNANGKFLSEINIIWNTI